MSVGVELDRLHEEVGRFGAHPYLLTVSDDGRPHATSITVTFEGDELVAGVGRRSAANVGERPDVTMLWAPIEDGGFSLIVDGRAAVDGERVVLRPEKAILHRQAAGGGSDCVKLEA